MIGAWVLLGLCTMLLVTGITKIDPSLYEAAKLDGAALAGVHLDHRPGPSAGDRRLRDGHGHRGAWRASTSSISRPAAGPGCRPTVPGLEIYRLAFAHRQVGLASALAVVLMVLVIVCDPPDPVVHAEDAEARKGATSGIVRRGRILVGLMFVTLLALHHDVLGLAGAVGKLSARPAMAVRAAMAELRRGVRGREHGSAAAFQHLIIAVFVVPVSVLIANPRGLRPRRRLPRAASTLHLPALRPRPDLAVRGGHHAALL